MGIWNRLDLYSQITMSFTIDSFLLGNGIQAREESAINTGVIDQQVQVRIFEREIIMFTFFLEAFSNLNLYLSSWEEDFFINIGIWVDFVTKNYWFREECIIKWTSFFKIQIHSQCTVWVWRLRYDISYFDCGTTSSG